MFDFILKKLSILKKFLLINLIAFLIIGMGTIIYLKTVQPNLIKKKSVNHIKIINNTVDNLDRLEIDFNEEEVNQKLNLLDETVSPPDKKIPYFFCSSFKDLEIFFKLV